MQKKFLNSQLFIAAFIVNIVSFTTTIGMNKEHGNVAHMTEPLQTHINAVTQHYPHVDPTSLMHVTIQQQPTIKLSNDITTTPYHVTGAASHNGSNIMPALKNELKKDLQSVTSHLPKMFTEHAKKDVVKLTRHAENEVEPIILDHFKNNPTAKEAIAAINKETQEVLHITTIAHTEKQPAQKQPTQELLKNKHQQQQKPTTSTFTQDKKNLEPNSFEKFKTMCENNPKTFISTVIGASALSAIMIYCLIKKTDFGISNFFTHLFSKANTAPAIS